MQLGTLRAIWRYRVKSLSGEELSRVDVLPGGIPGDRAGSLIVRSGHSRVGKPYRGKEHERFHLTTSIGDAIEVARERGVDLEFRDHGAGHEFDAAPISLLFDSWLAGVSEHVGYAVEYQRFRPNFFVAALPGFSLAEGALAGRILELGTLRLRVRGPIGRCVVTTYDPSRPEGPSDPEILRYVARERDNRVGIYCDVVDAGTTSIGDAVTSS